MKQSKEGRRAVKAYEAQPGKERYFCKTDIKYYKMKHPDFGKVLNGRSMRLKSTS